MIFTQKVKIQKRNSDGTVRMTVPKRFAEALGLESGAVLTIVLDTDKPNELTIEKEGQ